MGTKEKTDYMSIVEGLSYQELLNLQLAILAKLQEFGNSGLKVGQKILIGGKYAFQAPFDDEDYGYKNIVGQYGYIKNAELGVYGHDDNGEEVSCIEIKIEKSIHTTRRKIYSIHPDDAIVIED